MIKPRDYDQVDAKTTSAGLGIPAPEAGGHGCVILKADIEKNEYGEKLVLYFDINEGSESDRYYRKLFDYKKGYDPQTKWPGVFRQPIYTKDGTTSPYFKGLITAIEESNPGYTFNFDERLLANKKVGLVFRDEEYIGKMDGNVHTAVRAAWACKYQDADAMPAPKKKLVNQNAAPAQSQQMTEAPEEELPF